MSESMSFWSTRKPYLVNIEKIRYIFYEVLITFSTLVPTLLLAQKLM